ncbi:CAP domain-containing protein [Lentinula aff. detonsa]|uniref:CAP domain-containing protein n=1 Tax=Lentinula aff. detonsa TaxID=2804958 RepID=A0AA38NSD9_9AGAR|nr:CAP domain-containing protein [Lentinula aff. detonsa]
MNMVSTTTRTATSTRTVASTSTRPTSSTSITSIKPTSSLVKPSSITRTTFAITTISAQSPTKPAVSGSMTTSLPSSNPSTSAISGATQSFVQATLNSHNIARAQYGASPLTWNSNLYPGTQQWANACVFQHSGGNYGENLAAAAPQSITVQQGVNLWMTEASMYNCKVQFICPTSQIKAHHPTDSNPTFSSSTGHFTQVVWKSTTSVACATASCNFLGNGTGYLVCRYDPPGNYLGQFAQNVGRPSS